MPISDRARWRHASVRNFTQAEIDRANRNFQLGLEKYPVATKEVALMFDQHGLGDHASVIEHYLRTPFPPDRSVLSQLLMYPSATGVPYGRDEVLEPAKSNTQADRIYGRSEGHGREV